MFMFQMATFTNILIVVLSVCCATIVCRTYKEEPCLSAELILPLQEQVERLGHDHRYITDKLDLLLHKVEKLRTILVTYVGN